ncbi:MAG: hypothetical protein EA360_11750 [Balneolaceae bacterium]|nr:MAG: hypothetical protein EA360_11750 [Balneolaceae bacterium]
MQSTFYFRDAVRGMRIIALVLLFFILLVATHEGEFWPFSIYPMFSQAGNPWTRAMVLDVTDTPDELIWEIRTLYENDLRVVPVRRYGVDQIDFSNFISKTEEWTPGRRQALRTMFGEESLNGRRWIAASVHGEMDEAGAVTISIYPLLLITDDQVTLRPSLPDAEQAGEGF